MLLNYVWLSLFLTYRLDFGREGLNFGGGGREMEIYCVRAWNSCVVSSVFETWWAGFDGSRAWNRHCCTRSVARHSLCHTLCRNGKGKENGVDFVCAVAVLLVSRYE